MSDIESRIKKVIMEKLDVSEEILKPDASFIDDLGADSIDIVEFIMDLETEFDIEIPDEEAEKLTTVQDVIDYLESKV